MDYSALRLLKKHSHLVLIHPKMLPESLLNELKILTCHIHILPHEDFDDWERWGIKAARIYQDEIELLYELGQMIVDPKQYLKQWAYENDLEHLTHSGSKSGKKHKRSKEEVQDLKRLKNAKKICKLLEEIIGEICVIFVHNEEPVDPAFIKLCEDAGVDCDTYTYHKFSKYASEIFKTAFSQQAEKEKIQRESFTKVIKKLYKDQKSLESASKDTETEASSQIGQKTQMEAVKIMSLMIKKPEFIETFKGMLDNYICKQERISQVPNFINLLKDATWQTFGQKKEKLGDWATNAQKDRFIAALLLWLVESKYIESDISQFINLDVDDEAILEVHTCQIDSQMLDFVTQACGVFL